MMNTNTTFKKRGICGICNAFCGIEATVTDHKIIHVKGDENHPLTKGYICPKGRALPEIIHSKDRIKEPLKKDEFGNFQRISWEDAFNIIVEKLKYVKRQFGPETLGMHTGQSGVAMQFTDYVERFCTIYGTPNFSTAGSHCHTSKQMANIVTIGALPVADYENSKCIVLWGYNPSNSSPPQMIYINKSLKNGGKLIVIDPQETKLAKKADMHLKIRPGTDGALALGFIHIIIKENLFDMNFIKKWTIGFEELKEMVSYYTPEKVSHITGIPSETIVEAARLFGNNKPANISPGIAIELQKNGFQTARAISILQGITGNVDVTGGAVINKPIPLSKIVIDNKNILDKKPIGSDIYPLFYKLNGRAQANTYSDVILDEEPYLLRAMIIIGSNPLLTWPDANKLRKALKKLDFLVVMDNFMTETAKLADLIIPGTNYIERNEIWNGTMRFGKEIMGISPKIIDHKGITEWAFISQIARRLGYEEDFPWKTEEEAMDDRLKNMGKAFEEMIQENEPYEYGRYKEKNYERKGFDTPSKKIEIYSKTLEELGIDPLPEYYEPTEEPVLTKDLNKKYPLLLSAATRNIEYYHSRFRNIQFLNDYSSEKEPIVKVHPDTAEAYHIEDGEVIVIENERGKIRLKACVTESASLGAIFISHGWDFANVNELTDNKDLDPISGFPIGSSVFVRIKNECVGG